MAAAAAGMLCAPAAMGAAALLRVPGPPEMIVDPGPWLPEAPAAGTGAVTELLAHRRSGVVSVWLGNGVRVHHLWMKATPRGTGEGDPLGRGMTRLVVTVTVPGGEALETAETRGMARAATATWRGDQAATRSIRSPEFGHILSARGLEVTGLARPDALLLRVTAVAPEIEGDAAAAERAGRVQLDSALRAVRLLLTEPVVEAAALESVRAEVREEAARYGAGPHAIVSDAVMGRLLPAGDGRFRVRAPGPAALPDAPAVQAWLERTLEHAPLEVAIVGQVRLDDATTLAAKHLGSLPARERMSTATLREARFVAPEGAAGGGPIEVREPVGAGADEVCVGVGFLGPRELDLRTQRSLTLATLLLRNRASAALRNGAAGGDKEPVAAWYFPGGFYPPGAGIVMSAAVVPPARVEGTERGLREAVESLSAEEVAPEEFEPLRERFIERLRAVIGAPEYWSEVLACATYRGYLPDELIGAEEMIRGFTPAQIREVWRRYATPERMIRVVAPAK